MSVEILVVVLVVAALGGAVYWNKQTSASAMQGVEFAVDASPQEVAQAIRAAYCDGAKAKMKSVLSRMTVTPAGAYSFNAVGHRRQRVHRNRRRRPG